MAGHIDENVEYDPSDYPANYNLDSSDMERKANVIL
jgi:hypothetical protein